MIELFGPSADQVTALDRSPDMLRLARAKLPEDAGDKYALVLGDFGARSEEHTSELQSLMRISYAVFCLKKKKIKHIQTQNTTNLNFDKTNTNQSSSIITKY